MSIIIIIMKNLMIPQIHHLPQMVKRMYNIMKGLTDFSHKSQKIDPLAGHLATSYTLIIVATFKTEIYKGLICPLIHFVNYDNKKNWVSSRTFQTDKTVVCVLLADSFRLINKNGNVLSLKIHGTLSN